MSHRLQLFKQTLCGIFEKALGIDKVGIEDNFFDLGGSSLTASKGSNHVSVKEYQSIVYADIFKYPTVRELAAIAWTMMKQWKIRQERQ